MKKRLPKKYRHPKLEEQIRTYRTIHESQLLHEAKKVGVSTPSIFLVDVKRSNIIMEFIEGKQMKKLLGEVPERERKQLCFQIGKLIAKLHRGGIIHGDLTTSNMIMNAEGKIFFVDFGLGEKSDETESRGVDLHLMRRALQSTHFRFADSCFQAAVKGYCRVLGTEVAKNVLDKVAEIERRGRYVAERRTSE
jgi:TP53 regulating kinase-like protein